MYLSMKSLCRPGTLALLLACGRLGFAEAPPSPQPLEAGADLTQAKFSVEDGYLVAHLPTENVTVVARAVTKPVGEDQGWATWTQRGGLLWRGRMEDSQGRSYNVRILPGYVAPWRHGVEGWSDAASNLGEYGQVSTWQKLGRESRSCFRWGWEDSLWEFGLEGSGKAWSRNFEAAGRRVRRRTFGWPLAYPWATLSSTFETLLRVPLGAAGAAVGTLGGAVVVPAYRVAAPALKATYHLGVDGALLPVAGWTWQTLAAPPAALLASAPTPSRADGVWMQVSNPIVLASPAPDRILSAGALDTLVRYAAEGARLGAQEAEARLQEQKDLAELRARHEGIRKALRESRAVQVQAWASDPANEKALQSLVQEGGDLASIRANREALLKGLMGRGLTQAEAEEALGALRRHPLRSSAPSLPSHPRLPEKTDPVQGALETVDRVTGTRLVH